LQQVDLPETICHDGGDLRGGEAEGDGQFLDLEGEAAQPDDLLRLLRRVKLLCFMVVLAARQHGYGPVKGQPPLILSAPKQR